MAPAGGGRRKSRRRRWTAKIHQSWFVVAMCVGIIVGAIIGMIGRVNFFESAVWIAAAVVAMAVMYFQPRAYLLIFAVAAGMILSLHRFATELIGEDYAKQFVGQTITVAGTIDGDPETDDGGTKFKVRDLVFGDGYNSGAKGSDNAIADSGAKGTADVGHAAKGSLYVSMSKNEDLARGDEIVLEGKMSEGFGTYVGYLYRPKIVNWARPSPDLALGARNWFAARVAEEVSEPEVNLGLSYLLGMKAGLPDELSENLRTVGLTHIVVASGAHLSILVEIARKIFERASRFIGVGCSLVFVVFFMALVGWTPSIMRAGMMSILNTLAWTVGRKFAAWRIILLVAAGTLLINPMFLTNLGWLLSFASFGGIMLVGPKLAQFFYGQKRPKFIANMILTTLSATLLTLPITLYYFGAVSLISVLPNMLILPTLAYVMGLVFLAGVCASVPGLKVATGFLATKALDFHIGVVEFFGKMKSFLVEIETEQVWVFWLYLLILVPLAMGFWLQRRRKRKEKLRAEKTELALEGTG